MNQENINFILLFLLTFLTICVNILGICVIKLYIKQKAAELSTHKIEYVPLNPQEFAEIDKEVDEFNERAVAELDDDEVDYKEARRRNIF